MSVHTLQILLSRDSEVIYYTGFRRPGINQDFKLTQVNVIANRQLF